MRFRLPKDWKYEILSQSGDFYEYGIRFHLADVDKNMTFYCYSNRFGVCGTGLETKMILLESGMEAEIGYYDGSEDWSYVSFFNIDVKLAAINNGITGAEAKSASTIFLTLYIVLSLSLSLCNNVHTCVTSLHNCVTM